MEPPNRSTILNPLLKEGSTSKSKDKTFTSVAEEIYYLAHVRKATQEIIEDLYTRKIRRREEYLNALEIELEDKDALVIPDIDGLLEKNIPSSKVADYAKKVNDHHMLLSIMEKMKQCPVAKCIADI